ncbi:MAG: transglutaminase domain-containing protein [Waterburya sp.]
MTAKGRVKFLANNNKKPKKFGSKFIGSAIGISLLLTSVNIYNTINSFDNQELISLPAETFASNKYQPIQFGSAHNIAQQDFAEIDDLAKQLGYSGSSVAELAKLLEKNASTESAKARIIYAWVTQHITYNVPAFFDALNNDKYPDVSPERVLRDRTTICSGFSNLYYALASAMNLESVIVIGYAKGVTPEDDTRYQKINHAWNAVKIDQAWYLLDATWGAGSTRNNKFVPEYKPYYFATEPQEFINNHYPQDQGWQLLSQTYNRTEFDNLPSISANFYSLGLELVSHSNYQINTTNRVDIKFKASQDVVALAKLEQNTEELTKNVVLVNRQEEHLIVSVAPPEVGAYDLTIFAKQKDGSDQYGEVIKYQIEATNSTAELPKTYGHFYQYQASLIEPLVADLKPNWLTYFNLIVPEAIDVQVVNTTTKQWTALNGYGNYFAGNVDIQPGNILIVAKFPGSEQYWQLVEYQAK